MVNLLNDLHHRLYGLICHATGKAEKCSDALNEAPIDMSLKNTPNPLYWVILAVVRRVIGQLNGYSKLIAKLGQPFHELSPATIVLWPVVCIDDQFLDPWKSMLVSLPELPDTVYHEITTSRGLSQIQIELVFLR